MDKGRERKGLQSVEDLYEVRQIRKPLERYTPRSIVSRFFVMNDPQQVMNPEQLEVGRKYAIKRKKDHGQVESEGPLELIAVDMDAKTIKMRDPSKAKTDASQIRNYSMAELGFVPYPNEKWDAVNYLVPVKDGGKK